MHLRATLVFRNARFGRNCQNPRMNSLLDEGTDKVGIASYAVGMSPQHVVRRAIDSARLSWFGRLQECPVGTHFPCKVRARFARLVPLCPVRSGIASPTVRCAKFSIDIEVSAARGQRWVGCRTLLGAGNQTWNPTCHYVMFKYPDRWPWSSSPRRGTPGSVLRNPEMHGVQQALAARHNPGLVSASAILNSSNGDACTMFPEAVFASPRRSR